ncbi:MAG: ATP-dependent Clp protease adapter protein ClpS [Alphaproteobacteria bacterium MarineAlpha9_Bin4]|nr:ATP-dependent Clp protease adapter ClpS [Pelagibacterales bacterium]PPR26679.1 MAG: ATP-dependent Clp protease adapter protein ClpS [Alphaproteobacteria bacterium MarineAlpha9_Bin4]|tara:strand:+ start:744 stop:1049 length:306 start_codon:yes stop_codon:yes gene_type:complete
MTLNNDNNLLTKEKVKLKKPNMYAVVMLNDDYTPMEFVIYVLQSIFKKNYEDAKKIMLLIHNEGKGICGVFPLDIAETKANQVVEFARINQHPLECKVQKQ